MKKTDPQKATTILVPLDVWSPQSEALLKYAGPLASRLQAELLLLHVVEPTGSPYVVLQPYEALHQELIDSALTYLSGLDPLLGSVPHRTMVRSGHPATEIVAAALQEGAKLIVMATHGRTALSNMLMGSTAEDVLRNAPVPVLVLGGACLVGCENSTPVLTHAAGPT